MTNGTFMPESVINMDIAMMCNLTGKNITEFASFNSADRRQTSDSDLKMMRKCLSFFLARFDVFRSESELDLPVTHSAGMPVREFPKIGKVSNPDLQRVINLWSTLMVEMALSASAKRTAGVSEDDAVRFGAILERIGKTLDVIEAHPQIEFVEKLS